MSQHLTQVPALELEELAEAVNRLDHLESVCHACPERADPTSMMDALGDVYRASRNLLHNDPGPAR